MQDIESIGQRVSLMPIYWDNLTCMCNFSFKISLEKNYLGTEVTKQFKSLFQENFLPLIDKLRDRVWEDTSHVVDWQNKCYEDDVSSTVISSVTKCSNFH